MSAPMRNEAKDLDTPSMYAPPWARDAKDTRDAPLDASETALKASDDFRRTLPPAPKLNEDVKAFEGDVAIRRMRERPSLEPFVMPAPPPKKKSAGVGVFVRLGGAMGIAALVAAFMIGVLPLPVAVKAEGEANAAPLWSRLSGRQVQRDEISLNDRFAAVSALPETPAPAPAVHVVRTAAIPAEPVSVTPVLPAPVAIPQPVPAPVTRTLDQAEINMLYKRGEDLATHGDIAAARLMFRRAAEARDAKAALALAASYDPDVLKKLGVIGMAADLAQAREWYAKASEFGSTEAKRRLTQLEAR